MSDNTGNTATPVAANYETKISAVVAAILQKKNRLNAIYSGLWGVMVENFNGLTALEFKVIRSEVGVRLKASDFADASVNTQLSVISKLIGNAKELPETWNKAKAEYAAMIEAERAANPGKGKTGRKPRQPSLKSEAAGTVAVDTETGEVIDGATGAPTGETVEPTADPVGDMLASLRPAIAALLVAGIDLADVESNIVNVLASLADLAAEAPADPILDESDELEAGDFVSELTEQREAA